MAAVSKCVVRSKNCERGPFLIPAPPLCFHGHLVGLIVSGQLLPVSLCHIPRQAPCLPVRDPLPAGDKTLVGFAAGKCPDTGGVANVSNKVLTWPARVNEVIAEVTAPR